MEVPELLHGYSVRVVENERDFSFLAILEVRGRMVRVEGTTAQDAVDRLLDQFMFWYEVFKLKGAKL